MNGRRAVFLDRDGVINQALVLDGKPRPPSNLAEVRLVPDVERCCQDLKRAGFMLIVVTNQPDVARGRQIKDMVEEIHAFLMSRLPIDEFFVCYHDDGGRCACRKPEPGMLLDAARKYEIDLKNSFLIGDRWRDIEAGQRAHCTTVFIDYGYIEDHPRATANFETASLRDAVDWILEKAT
jgi:D-glycero-D-manno-heptose 1,7-bisphosphate phosphatase